MIGSILKTVFVKSVRRVTKLRINVRAVPERIPGYEPQNGAGTPSLSPPAFGMCSVLTDP
jgi:hypothetical protein